VVCKLEEALDCFLRTKMDVLVMEGWFVRLGTESAKVFKAVIDLAVEPTKISRITEVHATHWRTWRNRKMPYHQQGDYGFVCSTMHTNGLRVFSASN